MLKQFRLLAAVCVTLLGMAAPAMAATQTLTIAGGNGVQGDLDPYTEYSLDNGATWHQAVMTGGDGSVGNPLGCWHPWGIISGTTCWINQNKYNTVGIGISQAQTSTTLYRVRFYVPADAVNPTANIQMKADNHADVTLNGQSLGSFEGGPLPGNPDPTTVFNSAVQPGANELDVKVTDWGGITGLNYLINITMDSAGKLSLLPASSSPAGQALANTTLGRTPWQMSHPHGAYSLPSPATNHGEPNDYVYASIPAENDPSWGPAPNGDTIGFSQYSILWSCMWQVDYHYFQTFVTVPANTTVSQFSIDFAGMDDGSRITIFNSAYPNGIVIPGSYVYLGATGTTDLSSYVVPGVNRVVVTQVDDCPTGNNLQSAVVHLNGNVVSYNQPPTANAGSYAAAECTGGSAANVTLDGSASTDPDNDPLTYSWTWAGGSATGVNPTASFGLGTTPVTLTVDDGHGHQSSATTNVTVQDTTAPTVNAGSDVTLEATSTAGAAFDLASQATASDTCCPVSVTTPAAATYALGQHTLTASATDCSNNTGSDSMLLTVQDTTPPVLTVPADVTAEANGNPGSTVAIGTATATDIFPVTITSNAPATYPLGTTVVTWTATDANGNSVTGTQNVTVQDTTPPSLTLPGDVTAEANGNPGSTVAIGNASGSDLFGPVSITSNAPATYPLGTTVVTWTATDANGNVTTGTQNVTVQDTTPPSLTLPGDVTVEATGPQTSVAIGTATGSDLFGPVAITSDAPATYPLGTTVVTWTAVDANGNSTTGTQNVTVKDTTPPTVTAQLVPVPTGHGESDEHRDSGLFQVVFTASDLVDPNPALTATLNGATVTNGQIVKLEAGRRVEIESEHGKLEITAPSFTLNVNATDFSGNTGTASASFAFPPHHEGDSHSDHGIHRGNDKADHHKDSGKHKSEGKAKVEHKKGKKHD